MVRECVLRKRLDIPNEEISFYKNASSSIATTDSETEKIMKTSQPIGPRPRYTTKNKRRRISENQGSSDFSTPEKRRNPSVKRRYFATKNRKIKYLQKPVRKFGNILERMLQGQIDKNTKKV